MHRYYSCVVDEVKGSTYRQQQAEATRLRVADAAQELFATAGYGPTSIEAIARRAGVGTRTVYAAFGAKREILNLICERWLERARARELADEVLGQSDPLDRLRGAAHWLITLYSADFDVVRILDAAMDGDAETRRLLQGKLRGRNMVMDRLMASVADQLVVPLEHAQAVFRAYAAQGVYAALVLDAGWTPAQVESWLAETLVVQLMGGRS
ncbi:TetR/AcrR family transcriptional regulator [Granulicoccus phenolivorans]|uniref:TetR/AcrR family transcriptional regulator n=1 Tax=Granulicoccus phenolivorans TaxID=266854 RepID=UPI000686C2C2|nr:TetR/AcrR family transcriptional regulator [Granulicoccus phenolivorans]